MAKELAAREVLNAVLQRLPDALSEGSVAACKPRQWMRLCSSRARISNTPM
jgi:hypothetical protein